MKRPNLVFLLVDDLGWRDLSCQGSTFYETPHIDRLAAEGMRFTDAYATCTVCSPTRASIMTGKYPARVGITDWIDHRGRCHPLRGKLIDAPYLKNLPKTETTLAAALREGGYSTWHVGKWHLGGPEHYPDQMGFEVNHGGCEFGHPGGKNHYFSPWDIPTLEDGPEGKYLDDHLTDLALDLIRRQPSDKPFFLNLWYYLVHTPLMAKPADVAYFTEKARRMGLDQIDPFVEGEYFHTEDKRGRRVRRRIVQSDPVYAAMIKCLDDNIGRLRAVLEETGALESTVILFTSDNGGLATAEGSPTCNAPLQEGKGWMYEGGTREPLIAWRPGMIPAGMECAVPVTSTDFYPTLLELAGLPLRPQQHVDGVSILPLLQGGKKLKREAIFWHYPHYGNQGGTPGCSVRAGDWKLLEFFEDNRTELYNVAEDPGETRDRAAEEPAIRQRLSAMLDDWRAEVGALLPLPNPDDHS